MIEVLEPGLKSPETKHIGWKGQHPSQDHSSLIFNFELPLLHLMIKLKVVKQIPHVYHFHDTNSLASVSGMSLFCLSAPSSSAWSNSKRNVYSTGLGLCVLKHGKAWQSWVGLQVGIEMKTKK